MAVKLSSSANREYGQLTVAEKARLLFWINVLRKSFNAHGQFMANDINIDSVTCGVQSCYDEVSETVASDSQREHCSLLHETLPDVCAAVFATLVP